MDILIKDYHDSHMRDLQREAAADRLAQTFSQASDRRTGIRLFRRLRSRRISAGARPSRSRHALPM